MSKYAAILVDLDGTLMDTSTWHRSALAIAMAQFGGHGLFMGDAERGSFDQITEHLADCHCTSADVVSVQELYEAKWDVLHGLLLEATRTRQRGVEGNVGGWYIERALQPAAVMARLIAANRDRCLIVTDTLRPVAQAFLMAELGHADLPIFAREKVSDPGKMPHGILYRNVLEQLHVAPSDAVVIEDDPRVFKCANEIGLQAWKVDGPTDASEVLAGLLEGTL